jgi:hypothetical protein
MMLILVDFQAVSVIILQLLMFHFEIGDRDESQALHDAVDDACRLDQPTAAGGDQFSQGREQNIKARAFKSYR